MRKRSPTIGDLNKKYRPQSFKQVYGNEVAKRTLRSFPQEEIPHAILFHGPHGCGKTTLARIVASKVNCSKFDLEEIDVGDFKGIDTIRALRSKTILAPMEGPAKVWILDEAAELTGPAQNALLKILEEPPEHVYFFLCTTEPNKLKKTIRSRCLEVLVETLSLSKMEDLLTMICVEEKWVIPYEVITQINHDSLGHPRDAMILLNSISRLPQKEMIESVKHIAAEQNKAFEMCQALMTKKSWKVISSMLQNLEEPPETVRRIVRSYFKTVLLRIGDYRAATVMDCLDKPYYNTDDKNQLVLDVWLAWKGLNNKEKR